MSVALSSALIAAGLGWFPQDSRSVAPASASVSIRPFEIRVVDAQTGRGVPLVELRTTNEQRFLTDSQGVVAFAEPGLMNQRVFFFVKSHGYEFPRDGFGMAGRALDVVEGGHAELKLERRNIAERLYRITGGGIYRDSVLTGRPAPIEQPLLNAQVLGQDSVQNAILGGKLYWFWGDTNRPRYPLGNFHMPGATSALPGQGGLDPDRGVNLSYWVDAEGFARGTCVMPGEGPTWMGGLAVVRDPRTGRERMFGSYAKIRNMLEAYERGLVEWNADKAQFEKVCVIHLNPVAYPDGHPFTHRDRDTEYLHFGNPYPLVRVPARPDAYIDLSQYEAFTCLEPGSRLDAPRIDRHADGRPRYAWRKDAPALLPADQAKLVKAGTLKESDVLLPLRDVETGKPVLGHSGSVAWNPHRGRWTLISVEFGGSSSMLGEVWYSEADTPVGPWVYARKVVSHEKYSYYNPKQHPYFAQRNGRLLYFEGTYTSTFSGNTDPTPRYDYNQMMYRLDLEDPRLRLPVAVYDTGGQGQAADLKPGADAAGAGIAFFAPDRPAPGTVPVWIRDGALIVQDGPEGQPAAFHLLPADAENPAVTTTPLWEYQGPDGARRYSVEPERQWPGFSRAERPVGRVWADPWRGRSPLANRPGSAS